MNDFGEIHALADSQIEGDARAAAQERVQQCPRSRAEYETVLALKRTLRRCPEVANDQLWSQCRARLDEIDRVRRTESFVGRYAWAICCLFFVAILGAAVLNRQFGGNTLYASDVPRMLSSISPVAGSTGGSEDLRAALRLSSLRVPEAVSTGERLVGLGRGAHQGRQLAAFIYGGTGNPVTVFVRFSASELEGAAPVGGGRFLSVALEGANCITWQRHGRRFFVVGPQDLDYLCRFADAFSRGVR